MYFYLFKHLDCKFGELLMRDMLVIFDVPFIKKNIHIYLCIFLNCQESNANYYCV